MDKAAAVPLVKKYQKDDYLKMQMKLLWLTTVKLNIDDIKVIFLQIERKESQATTDQWKLFISQFNTSDLATLSLP